MPDQLETNDLDFAGEMSHLAREAESKVAPPHPGGQRDLLTSIAQLIRPLALELESVKRSLNENTAGARSSPQQSVTRALEGVQQQLQRLGAVETANQKLFDALHTELKGYKDNFLFDALQRPFVRDLVSIFDDFSAVYAQMLGRLSEFAVASAEPRSDDWNRESEPAFLTNLAGNVNNQLHHLMEVFLRMEVVLSQSPTGCPVDKRVHRTMGFEPAASAAEDGMVTRSLKPGFTWRDRIIRPEEVMVARWHENGTAPLEPAAEPIAEPAEDSHNLASHYPPE